MTEDLIQNIYIQLGLKKQKGSKVNLTVEPPILMTSASPLPISAPAASTHSTPGVFLTALARPTAPVRLPTPVSSTNAAPVRPTYTVRPTAYVRPTAHIRPTAPAPPPAPPCLPTPAHSTYTTHPTYLTSPTAPAHLPAPGRTTALSRDPAPARRPTPVRRPTPARPKALPVPFLPAPPAPAAPVGMVMTVTAGECKQSNTGYQQSNTNNHQNKTEYQQSYKEYQESNSEYQQSYNEYQKSNTEYQEGNTKQKQSKKKYQQSNKEYQQSNPEYQQPLAPPILEPWPLVAASDNIGRAGGGKGRAVMKEHHLLPDGWKYKYSTYSTKVRMQKKITLESREGFKIVGFTRALQHMKVCGTYSRKDMARLKEMQRESSKECLLSLSWEVGDPSLPQGWSRRIAPGHTRAEFILSPQGRQYRSRYNKN